MPPRRIYWQGFTLKPELARVAYYLSAATSLVAWFGSCGVVVLRAVIIVVFVTMLFGCGQAGLSKYDPTSDPVLFWNQILLELNALDHGLSQPNQGGPTKTSRAFAIVEISVFDAVNSIVRRFHPYHVSFEAPGASLEAAVGSAAYHSMVSLFPSHASWLQKTYQDYVEKIDGPGLSSGVSLGQQVATEILALRNNDGSRSSTAYTPVGGNGRHVVDPINPNQGYLDPHWGSVRPFVIPSPQSIPVPAPPGLQSEAYARAYQEVMYLGGNGTSTSTFRTLAQLLVGLFWSYDGSPGLGTPPRLYNQITQTIAAKTLNDLVSNARLFALVNLALADAGIQCWEAKYRYDLWRPIIALRTSTSNPFLPVSASWTPFGAPLSNKIGNNFTPNFPAYPSGHATFGAAMFRMLARYYGTDSIPFDFVSDELNGVTTDNQGITRPLVPRSFHSFSAASEENGQSRIYLGIHWEFDKTAGINSGNSIADYVFTHSLRPR